MRAWIVPTIALLIIGGAGFGAGWAANEWRDDDDEESAPDEALEGGETPATEKTFSLTLEGAWDYQRAAQRIGAFMPDFDCTGEWDEERKEGKLECDAGLTGFDCEMNAQEYGWPRVSCGEGDQLPSGFPTCTVEKSGTHDRHLIRCSGPSTDAVCEVQRGAGSDRWGVTVTCQRP